MAAVEVTLYHAQTATVVVDADPGTPAAELTRLALAQLDDSGGVEWHTHQAWTETPVWLGTDGDGR